MRLPLSVLSSIQHMSRSKNYTGNDTVSYFKYLVYRISPHITFGAPNMLKINCKGLTKTGSHKVIANMLCLWFKFHSDGDITGLLHQIPLSHSLDSLNTFISTSYFFLVLY